MLGHGKLRKYPVKMMISFCHFSARNCPKKKRLSDLGIPIYDVYDFILPDEIENLLIKCKEAVKDKWKISLRFSDLHDQLIFRQLDIDIDSIVVAVENFTHLSKFKVRVSPYKTPYIVVLFGYAKEMYV